MKFILVILGVRLLIQQLEAVINNWVQKGGNKHSP